MDRLSPDFSEAQWAALVAQLPEHRPMLPPDRVPMAERVAALQRLIDNGAVDPKKLRGWRGQDRGLEVVVLALGREFGALPAKLAARLERLRGLEVRARVVDPEAGALPEAALYVVLLGAGLGRVVPFEAALGDEERCIGLMLDPLSREQARPHRADGAQREALLDRFEGRFTPFADPDGAAFALEEPLARWLERHRPAARGLLQPFERAYLRTLELRCEGGSMRHLSGVVHMRGLSREALYVSLHAARGPWRRDRRGDVHVDEREPGRYEAPPIFLDELLSHPKLPQALVEGEAGSGKTVLLQHLALSLARIQLGGSAPAESRLAFPEPPVPVLLEASQVGGALASPKRAEALVRATLGADHDLSEELVRGRYLLLIDALDEVPGEQARSALLGDLAGLARQLKALRFVLTSRPGAHTGVAAPPPLRLIGVAELDEERRAKLVRRWAKSQSLSAEEAEDVGVKLGALESRFPEDPSGRSPLTNPLLCTAALFVYWQERRLPENVADLFERLVLALCRSRVEGSETAEGAQRALLLIGRALQEGGETRIRRRDAAGALLQAGMAATQSEAEARVDRLMNATGILRTETTARGVELRPWHRGFQEYLAAASLLDTGRGVDEIVRELAAERGDRSPRLHDPFWTGTLRLAVGVFGAGGKAERARDLVQALVREAEREPDSAAGRRREGHILALAVAGLREYREEHFSGSGLLRELPERVARRYEVGGVDWGWRDRVEALDALGALGDPRLPDPREGLAGWVHMQAAEPWLGGDRAALHSLPKQRFWHGPLQVRRHPVTVKEYAAFVEEGGPRPEAWGAQQLHPNRPVVRVSWENARAFCAWAQKAWLLPEAGVVDLPTSREWEAIALGDRGGPFPWGDEPPGDGDASRAAYNWGNILVGPHKAPLPVGAFPGGHAGGLWDVAGNVWEWCATAWDGRDEVDLPRLTPNDIATVIQPIDCPAEPIADATHVPAGRVLRGGSWNSSARYLRCTLRLWDRPGLWFQLFGFRVLVRAPTVLALDP